MGWLRRQVYGLHASARNVTVVRGGPPEFWRVRPGVDCQLACERMTDQKTPGRKSIDIMVADLERDRRVGCAKKACAAEEQLAEAARDASSDLGRNRS
jgi:hypothetical protein